MENFGKAFWGFVMALAATVVFGAQLVPAHLSLESLLIFTVKCIPEALFAPLFFPLAMCYSGCGFSDWLLGPHIAAAVPAFGSDFLGALVRACVIGLAFWLPWVVEAVSPAQSLRERRE